MSVSEKVVRRIMAEEGLSAARRRRRYSSYRGEEGLRAAPNLVLVDEARDLHDFSAGRPGALMATDISEFRLGAGGPRACLSPMVDMRDGRAPSWAAGTSPPKALVAEMLGRAAPSVRRGRVAHTDRGWRYRTRDRAGALAALGAVRSMSRGGHSPDNAPAEGLLGRPKVEFFLGRDWSGWAPEAFIGELGRYIGWYNSGRLKAFRGGGRTVYDTIDGRRARPGLAA